MLVSKKELCHKLGLVSPAGRCYYQLLYYKVLFPILIQPQIMTHEEVKKVRVFDIHASMRIIRSLDLEDETQTD